MSELKPPQPLPEGVAWEQAKLLKVSDGEWRRNEKYVCRTCGQPSYMHPNTNSIWGCKECGMTTASASIYFKPAHH